MHHSLEIEEVLRYILEFLYGDPQGPNRRSILNLAITCRTFLRPALEILWFDLPSLGPLVPLIMGLPVDAWGRNVMSDGPTLVLRRALLAADWNRLQRYAPFVKSCSHPPAWGSGVAGVDTTVFRALRIFKPNTPVLPNLRILVWNPPKFNQADLTLFLTTNLLEFSSVKARPAMLVALKQTCTRLRKLDIRTDHISNPHFISSLSDLVVHLPSLEIICSPVPLTDDAIVHLSMLPNLKELQIPNDAADFMRAHEKNPSHPMFSALVVFNTCVDDLSSIVSLLTLCRPKRLRALILKTQPTQVRDAEQLFIALASCCSHDALESISFHTRRDLPNQVSSSLPPFSAHVLKHLFVFRNLWNLSLDLPFDLDDAVVEQMAASWPGMRQMVVQFIVTEDHPKITLRSLVAMPKHWRNLVRVTLVLKVSYRDLASLQRDIKGLQENYKVQRIAHAKLWVDDSINPAYVLYKFRPREAYSGMEPNNQSPTVLLQVHSHWWGLWSPSI